MTLCSANLNKASGSKLSYFRCKEKFDSDLYYRAKFPISKIFPGRINDFPRPQVAHSCSRFQGSDLIF